MDYPKYPKMSTVFERDPDTKWKTILPWRWGQPEFEYLANLPWQFEEKIHGTNIRVQWDGAVVTVSGRTDNAQIPAFLLTKLQELFYNHDAWDAMFGSTPTVLYGEGFGDRIQDVGKLYLPGAVDFALFDVAMQGEDGRWRWQERWRVTEVAAAFGVRRPPLIWAGQDLSLRGACGATLGGPTCRSFINDAAPIEGWVARPMVELASRGGGRIICKLKLADIPQEGS